MRPGIDFDTRYATRSGLSAHQLFNQQRKSPLPLIATLGISNCNKLTRIFQGTELEITLSGHSNMQNRCSVPRKPRNIKSYKCPPEPQVSKSYIPVLLFNSGWCGTGKGESNVCWINPTLSVEAIRSMVRWLSRVWHTPN